jgi:hypothetical protein
VALRVRGFVRIGAAMAGCALFVACTPEPGPAVTPSPAPATVTPTETDIERQQRLDYEKAEEAYRRAVAEGDRLAQLGIAKRTPELEAVATDEYLELQVYSLQQLKKRGLRQKGTVTIVEVSRSGGWSTNELNLVGCEDNSTWRVIDGAGKDVTPRDQQDYVQTLTVVKTGTSWKVSDLTSKKVKNVRPEDCKQ